jgi:hypothetical protein
MPEGNRPCCRAAHERGYDAHLIALRRIQGSGGAVDTSAPIAPQKVGRNYKRYENEQQRNEEIIRDNLRLVGKMDRIAREEHYPRAVPQRPFTLQGQAQKDEMARIMHENRKLLTAVQERRPILNRNDWFRHKLDHEYQTTRISEYRQTVPMGEILREELRGSVASRRSTAAPESVTSTRTRSSRRSGSVRTKKRKRRIVEVNYDDDKPSGRYLFEDSEED